MGLIGITSLVKGFPKVDSGFNGDDSGSVVKDLALVPLPDGERSADSRFNESPTGAIIGAYEKEEWVELRFWALTVPGWAHGA